MNNQNDPTKLAANDPANMQKIADTIDEIKAVEEAEGDVLKEQLDKLEAMAKELKVEKPAEPEVPAVVPLENISAPVAQPPVAAAIPVPQAPQAPQLSPLSPVAPMSQDSPVSTGNGVTLPPKPVPVPTL